MSMFVNNVLPVIAMILVIIYMITILILIGILSKHKERYNTKFFDPWWTLPIFMCPVVNTIYLIVLFILRKQGRY